jgi:uncharacterized alkaline shock family protein YloU
MDKELSSEYGQIKIHRRVISQVAEMTARQVEGVKKVGLECYGFMGEIMKLLRFIGEKITIGANKEVKISLPIVIDYNYNVVDVSYEVQRKVAAKLLDTLNMESLSIDIKIKRVERG